MSAESYMQVSNPILSNGKEICGRCPYQLLYVHEKGEFADFSRQECEDIGEDFSFKHGISSDVPCGLAAREILKLATLSGEINA